MRYYESVAALMMPHLRGRPTAFVRAPEGIESGTSFQKHLSNLPPWEGYWHCRQSLHEVARQLASAERRTP